ncbi:MAG: serine hydrolase domain-containing protein [Candidatus Aminicenantales bacterium]
MILAGLEQRKVPSVSIAVARKGRVVWEQSFGWADRERRIPASPETVYSLASTTKPMVATAVMILARAGKIDLAAPAERYIGPGRLTVYAGRAADVTVRRLLHHTAGLPQHFNYFYADEPDRPPSLEMTVRRFGLIVQPPGERFQYANLGYAILGDIIARVSGKPLDAFLREEVFRPLGLATAAFEPDLPRPGRVAIEYDGRGTVVPFHVCDTPGAGQGYASARDLIRFGMFHLKDHLEDQKPVLDDDAIDRMQTEKDGAAYAGGAGESYGLGWFFADTAQDARTVWHEGGWTGASALLKLVPKEDLAAAVLINAYDSEFINRVADAVIQAVLPAYGTPASRPAGNSPADAAPPFEPPAGVYAGEVRLAEKSVPLILEKDAAGKIGVRFGDLKLPLKPVFVLPAIVTRAPGQFLGAFAGPIGDSAADRRSHRILLDLRWTGDELVGTASAMTMGGQTFGPADDPRMRFYLPYRARLKRAASK